MTALATEGQALLRGIIDHPTEDDRRLIYADWLEECGDEIGRARAEFIRVQIELDEPVGILPGSGEVIRTRDFRSARQQRLLVREEKLFTWANINAWGGRSEAWQRTTVSRKEFDAFTYDVGIALFRRGFVEAVRLTLHTWQQFGPALIQAHPFTRVELSDREPCGYIEPEYDAWSTELPTAGDLSVGGNAALPHHLFLLLTDYAYMIGTSVKMYENTALDALSTVLLASVKPRAIR